MLGVEVIGIIFGIIVIVDVIVKVYNVVNDVLGFLEVFCDIVIWFFFVCKIFQIVFRNFNNINFDEEYCKVIKFVLECCENRVI